MIHYILVNWDYDIDRPVIIDEEGRVYINNKEANPLSESDRTNVQLLVQELEELIQKIKYMYWIG